MYFINHEQIDQRIQFLDCLSETCKQLEEQWQHGESTLILQMAQERVLHLAIETVTDVGSLLIDAFILRDASSYEDIVEIVHGEGAYSETLTETLLELVKLRKPLVQEYVSWNREQLNPLIPRLPAAFQEFAVHVKAFIKKEME
ncbi:DUF86 domain-containing protein [Paenibacillus sp. SYP-B3998]|uniref:DUF86 domain-containing protein n=1 Tax=Paenibacillus sp. SYP-B3998 TaxID=2678564 RepID=A0A6G4A1U5_9BACL|nr:HepT-like ribonuclease domain-containing protein [Paenibacillus sp. SYP-B3998]NEW07617.1 DUF86 domain-containing protein [Paenibacillus sp. SYP-B3998]